MNGQIFSDRQQILSPEAIVTKIDMIIQEIERLRTMVSIPHSEPSETGLADKLFGILGNGTWAEYWDKTY